MWKPYCTVHLATSQCNFSVTLYFVNLLAQLVTAVQHGLVVGVHASQKAAAKYRFRGVGAHGCVDRWITACMFLSPMKYCYNTSFRLHRLCIGWDVKPYSLSLQKL